MTIQLPKDKRDKLAYHLIDLLWNQISTGARLRREQQCITTGWSRSGHNLAQSGRRIEELETLYSADKDTFRAEIAMMQSVGIITQDQYNKLSNLAHLVRQAMDRTNNNFDHPRNLALARYWSMPKKRSKGYRKVESRIRSLFVSPHEQRDIDTKASESDAIRMARRMVIKDMQRPNKAALKIICKAVGVSTTGNKRDMAVRITDYLIHGKYWRDNLTYLYNTILEPTHTFGINVPDWDTF